MNTQTNLFQERKRELTNRIDRNASCCLALIKASFSKSKDSPSSGLWLVATSSINATDDKEKN